LRAKDEPRHSLGCHISAIFELPIERSSSPIPARTVKTLDIMTSPAKISAGC
jgi:hypothetical protein